MLTLELFYKVQSRTDLSTENFANLYGLFDQVFLESDHIKTNANKDWEYIAKLFGKRIFSSKASSR